MASSRARRASRRPSSRLLAAGALAALGGLLVGVAPAPAATPTASQASVAEAVGWLATQQQSDGGFEVAGFPGFETPDVILALAEAAQTGTTWSTAQALAGVTAVQRGGLDALDAIDTFATSGIDAGQAAKLIVLVAEPLGLDPISFDPAGDGNPVDLAAIVAAGGQPDGTYGAFNATLYAALALRLTTGAVPPKTVTAVIAAQQVNGAWGYAGDPTGGDEDPDTTGLALQVLAAAGLAPTEAHAAAGLYDLAKTQQTDGGWKTPFDATSNPNSTAVVATALAAFGYDPTTPCWRDTAAAGLAGTAYGNPDAYVRGTQTPQGNYASPNDAYGLNTFPTSQGVQGLTRAWVVAEQPPVDCAPVTTTTTAAPTTTTVATTVEAVTTGASSSGSGGLAATGADAGLALLGAGAALSGTTLVGLARRRAR